MKNFYATAKSKIVTTNPTPRETNIFETKETPRETENNILNWTMKDFTRKKLKLKLRT